MEFPERAPNQRTHQTIKHNNQMKNPIRSLALGIALFGAVSAAMAQSSTLTSNATPTLGTTNTSFSFSRFDSGLGTLTAVDLILNSAVPGGSVNLQSGDAPSGSFSSLSGWVRTSGSGMTTSNSTSVSLNLGAPGLPYSPGDGESVVFSYVGGQSLISSPLTYSIGSGSWSSYQNAGGTGNTPNFTARLVFSTSVGTDMAALTGSSTAASSYTLRYTYTPSGPVPVPEPGQVAASLLLLGGIGAYYFVKRRRKSAPAAA
jgi:hypothetical protein